MLRLYVRHSPFSAKLRRLCFVYALLTASAGVFSPRLATAEIGKSTKTLIKTSAYGALAGTALGLASYPAHRSLRGVAMGASIGLYLGLAVGAYSLWSANGSGQEAPLFSQESPSEFGWGISPAKANENSREVSHKIPKEEYEAFPPPQLAVAVITF